MYYIYRGESYYKKEQYETAMKDYDEAVRIDPQNQSALNGHA